MPDPTSLDALLKDATSEVRPIGLSVNLDCPSIIEMAPRMGFSWLMINQDQTLIRGPLLAQMIRAADATRLPHFVQLASLDPAGIKDALDLGSYGVVTPGIETAAEVEAVFESVRYPPRGRRSFCSVGRLMGHSSEKYAGGTAMRDALRFGNEHALVIPTIATSDAVDNLDELMAIEECKIWHLSFSNLNLSFGLDPEENPRKSIKLFLEIAKHIHAAGRMVSAMIAPIEGQTSELAEGLDLFGNDLPYAIDSALLSFGMAEVRKIGEAHATRRNARTD